MTVSLAKAYRASADPLRVQESAVRRHLGTFRVVAGVEVIETGAFLPGGEGCYAALRVLGYREDAPFPGRGYSLHTLVLPAEADGPREPFLLSGTYDLTLAEAADRL